MFNSEGNVNYPLQLLTGLTWKILFAHNNHENKLLEILIFVFMFLRHATAFTLQHT